MPKPRTKRGAIREERKRKRQTEQETNYHTKRRRSDDDNDDGGQTYPDGETKEPQEQIPHHEDAPEKEFFGMLAEEEQEYFRSADEKLDQNLFDASLGETRENFVSGLFKEAEGKELKLASSQSCSRLMERLIQLSTPTQRKKLFEAFGGHFLSLVQHRFASHCCEALFLRSADVVTGELAGHDAFVLDTRKGGGEEEPMASMEDLFLATLDELEGSLSFLITDRFASHALRVLLLVLSGRPLNDAAFKTLLKSKKKENIKVSGADTDVEQGLRTVPSSFTVAVQKIISDSVTGMDATSLRVLAKHPIGNPTLQLLLELDLTLAKDAEKGSKAELALLQHLLPGAPKSLADESSPATEFVNSMVYDLIGSRLLETLITHAPGKIFKALNQNIFLPRIQGYVRNDVSSYPAIRVLNRLGKDDLVKAVAQIEPTLPQLVQKARFNVIRTLFERCVARGLLDEIKKLNRGLKQGCGTETADLVKTLCLVKDEEEEGKKKKAEVSQLARNDYAIQSHGAQLLTFLLSIPGPSKGVQESLLSLSPAHLLQLAQTSFPTVTVLTTALSTPSPNNPAFHKALTSTLILPNVAKLALSQNGHNLLTKLVEVPSKGKDCSVPFHMKEAVMDQLGNMEADLRGDWMGRSVWRAWKGDTWKTKRGDWKVWMREVDVVEAKPVGKSGGNAIEVKERKPREKKEVAPVEKPEADVEMEEEDEFKVDIREPEPEPKPRKEKKSKDKSEKKDKKDKKEKKAKKAKEEEEADEDVEMAE